MGNVNTSEQIAELYLWDNGGLLNNTLTRTTGRAIVGYMKQTTNTRERILENGLAVMSKYGLSGVTLGVLAEKVGMSKSGLFAHFKSKDEVQIDLLEYASQYGRPHIIEPAMKQPEGLPRLRALVSHWFGWAPRSGLPGGCPIAAGMFEYDDIDSPVRDKIIALEAAWRELLCELTQRAVELGHLNSALDIDQFVWELGGIYLAHHTSQRFLRSSESDRRATVAFNALVERARPDQKPGKTRNKARKGKKP